MPIYDDTKMAELKFKIGWDGFIHRIFCASNNFNNIKDIIKENIKKRSADFIDKIYINATNIDIKDNNNDNDKTRFESDQPGFS